MMVLRKVPSRELPEILWFVRMYDKEGRELGYFAGCEVIGFGSPEGDCTYTKDIIQSLWWGDERSAVNQVNTVECDGFKGEVISVTRDVYEMALVHQE